MMGTRYSMVKPRLPALLCALALVFCDLISRPFAEIGISDDWSYIRSAMLLEKTGHIYYFGWANAMVGWQLYLAALFIRVFGFSFTTVRMSTLLVAAITAFLVHRIFVRCGVNQRNATIATLAVVLSSIYMDVSVTFMTDMQGLFAIVLCLYACVRALNTANAQAAIGWIWFAAISNAVFGTSRQIAWLGVLVMVPSTLWLLRKNRQVLIAGVAAVLVGDLLVFCLLHWAWQQPYFVPEGLTLTPIGYTPGEAFIELPRGIVYLFYLVLPLAAAFIPEIRRSTRRMWIAYSAIALGVLALGIHRVKGHGGNSITEPMLIGGLHPILIPTSVRIFLTAVTMLAAFSLITFCVTWRSRPQMTVGTPPSGAFSRQQLAYLFVPFLAVYFALLIPRASAALFGRYFLGPMLLVAILLVRYFQDCISPRLPGISIAFVILFAVIGVAELHDQFAERRAVLDVVTELRAAGVADTDIDGGWTYNGWIYLQHARGVNEPRIVNPPHSYVPVHIVPDAPCLPTMRDYFVNFKPSYGIAGEPDACQGPAPVAPVRYRQWMPYEEISYYAVRYAQP
jgi:hypothetical protein